MEQSWMWHNEHSGGVQGAIVDEDGVRWFDEPGCACSGSDSEQSLDDFLVNGAHFMLPPDDILAEMRTFAGRIRQTTTG